MTTDLEALVVAGYVFADEYLVAARPGRRAKVSDAELVALAVCQAAIGISSDRQFLGLVGRILPGWFPRLPDQSQYNRRLRALVELISVVQQRLARWLDSGGVRLADGTLISVANYPDCAQRSEFAGFARYGYAKSQHRFVWGVRLVLLTDQRGLPLGYTLVPAGEKEHEPIADLLTGTPTRAPDRRQSSLGPRLSAAARGRRDRSAHPGQEADSRQRDQRTSTRLNPTHDRKRLRQPQRPNPTRTPPRQNTRRARATDRPTTTRAHPRHPAQHLTGRPARALAAYDGR
jgi:hypothetical protein